VRVGAALILGALFLTAAAGCGGAPQIIDYSPERGSTGVATNAPIRVDFDRAVDRASVAGRFAISPAAAGHVTWPSARELLFVEDAPLRTDTTYQVLLHAGYRSAGGGAADLDHAWYFRTEGALQVIDSTPAGAQTGVDPAAYLDVSFNHRMSAASLAAGFQLSPPVALSAMLAPDDPFHVVVAPAGLLAAGTGYTLTVTTAVKDAHGNPLPKPSEIAFRTGPTRPLHGWITCLATGAAAGPATGDLWMVDANRLPRQLLSGPISDYEWAPTADELTVETGQRAWQDRRLDGSAVDLVQAADLVLPLGGDRGFVYLDHGVMGVLSAAGSAVPLAQGVSEVALSPDGQQVAYTLADATGTQLWLLSVELRSRYQLGAEPGAVASLAWAPDSSRLAYQVLTAAGSAIRVRVLSSPAANTVATGEVSAPAWDADSSHLYLLAARGEPAMDRLYRIPTTAGAQTLTPGTALATPPGLTVGPPEPSSDGHQVAFGGTDARGDEIWLMNSDGTGLVRLTGGADYAYSCRAPRWTPPA
jgi:Big-like domain-containing protein